MRQRFLGSVVFGYVVARTGSYNRAFVPMAALLLLGALLWFRIDPTLPFTATSVATELTMPLIAQAD